MPPPSARRPAPRVVRGHASNAGLVLIGPASGQHFQLAPGESLTVPASNVSALYASTSGGSATVLWLATLHG